MAEMIKETVITQEAATPVRVEASKYQTVEYIIYYIFGTLEILLAFRLILKIMGASMNSAFVDFIYGLTGLFTLPFEGIFRRGISQGLETTSVLEPATLVAIIVYAFSAWGIVKLTRIFSREKQPTE